MSAIVPLVEEVIEVTQRLTALLEREIELLKNLKPQDIRDLQRDKAALAATYERHIRDLRAKPALLATADAKFKERLRQATMRFQMILAENERAIRAVKTVSERLMRAVVAAVADRKSGTPAYTRSGVTSGGAATAKAVSLAVNRQL
jgi:flagellar biosynthesis/type III secretory pathway chaperone